MYGKLENLTKRQATSFKFGEFLVAFSVKRTLKTVIRSIVAKSCPTLKMCSIFSTNHYTFFKLILVSGRKFES